VRPAPLRGRGALAVLEWAAQCHGADSYLASYFYSRDQETKMYSNNVSIMIN
jgi:hypothetical protein